MTEVINIMTQAVKVASTFGVNIIVNGACDIATANMELSTFKQTCCSVAKLGITGVVSNVVLKNIDETAEKVDSFVTDIKSRIDKKEKEAIKVEVKVEETEEVKEEKPKKTSKKKSTKKKELVETPKDEAKEANPESE